MEKKRLDVLLTEQGVFPSREQAKNAVAGGKIVLLRFAREEIHDADMESMNVSSARK